jgi:putative transposase
VERERAYHCVATLCKVLDVSTSGFWAWRKRPPSDRELADRELFSKISEVYRLSRDTYGAPRMYDELLDQGVRCGRKRIARLMRTNGLVGCNRHSRRAENNTSRHEGAGGSRPGETAVPPRRARPVVADR